MKTRAHVLIGGISLLAFASATVVAADSPASGTPATRSDGSGGTLEEVVVTANKREQNLSDVGLSVAALSSSALEDQRIGDVASLATVVPGLTFAPTPTSAPVYTLRGVGFFEQSLAAYPDVSLYVDQAPLPFPVLATRAIFDLERVEVLKGPQGTLFGNNATGGAINFIAAKPTQAFSAGVDIGYGRFNTVEASGFISGPLSDTLRARVAFKSVQGDEWQKSYTRVDGLTRPDYVSAGVPTNFSLRQDRLGKADNNAVRVLFEWTPNDRLTANINLNAWQDKNDPQAPQFIRSAQANPTGTVGPGGTVTADMPIINYPEAPRDSRAADWDDDRYRPFADNEFYQATARLDYNVTDAITLTSITSYAALDFLNGTEGDGTALNALDIGNDDGSIKTFSEEVRLSGDPKAAFRWVVGANYEKSEVDEVVRLYIADSTASRFAGYGANGYSSFQNMKNVAGFGNLEFDLSDLITLKAGVRRTKAERDSENSTPELVGDPGDVARVLTLTEFLNMIYAAVFGPQTPTIVPGESITFNPACGCAETFFGSLSEKSTSWSVGVDFKPSDDLLLYANVSKGYKAGSFATVAAAAFEGYSPVTQEALLDYEVGFKSTLANGALTLNGAVFYYDYEDKQTRAKFVDPVFGLLDKLVNVPKSEVKGAEIEIGVRPAQGLTLSLSATYLDAQITDYNGVVGLAVDENGLRVPVMESFDGVRLPYSPKWQASLRGDYEFPLSQRLTGLLGIGVNGQTESIGILTLLEDERQLYELNSRVLVNVNAGVQTQDGRWRAMLWGSNVLDKYYRTTTNLSNDTVFTFTGRPREYGITVGYKF